MLLRFVDAILVARCGSIVLCSASSACTLLFLMIILSHMNIYNFRLKLFFLQAREGPWELFHSAEVICLQQDLFSPEKEKEEITHTCEL